MNAKSPPPDLSGIYGVVGTGVVGDYLARQGPATSGESGLEKQIRAVRLRLCG